MLIPSIILSILNKLKLYFIQQNSTIIGEIFLVVALGINFVVGLVCDKAVISVQLHQVRSVVAQEFAFGLVGASVTDSEALNVDLVLESLARVPIVKSKIKQNVLFKQSWYVNAGVTFSCNVSLSVLKLSEDIEEF
jgi:hypothetical protein